MHNVSFKKVVTKFNFLDIWDEFGPSRTTWGPAITPTSTTSQLESTPTVLWRTPSNNFINGLKCLKLPKMSRKAKQKLPPWVTEEIPQAEGPWNRKILPEWWASRGLEWRRSRNVSPSDAHHEGRICRFHGP